MDGARGQARRAEAGAATTVIKILIVDDSAEARDGLRSILAASPDIEVAGVAASGSEALTMAERLRPDLVLVDAQMPEMDGAETTRRLKAQHPRLRVLFLAVHAHHIDPALEAGADDFVMKDASRLLLLEAVRRLAAESAAEGDAE